MAEATNSQNAQAGARTYCPSTTPNFICFSRYCVRISRIASAISDKNMTVIPTRWKVGLNVQVAAIPIEMIPTL